MPLSRVRELCQWPEKKLKRLLRGRDRGVASFFRIWLLISSGPEALPNWRDFKIDSTSWGEVEMELRLFSVGGNVAFVSSRIVWSTKKSFTKDALSAYSVWTMSSLQTGGVDVVLFGLIKYLSVFHQSRGLVSVFLSFAVNLWHLSITDCLALRISAVVMFPVCLYFSKSADRFVFSYFCINVCVF